MDNNVEKIDLNRVDWKSSREFFESLGEALDKLDDKDESYNFTWVGKRKSIIEAGSPINKTLRPDVEASKNFDDTKNMLIVGDNLDALKLLQESYLGKIKMIYIDPPYNTGKDFVYHDNFTIKKSDFSDTSTDSDGNILVSEDEYTENSKTNGRFHSDWLSMMYPRLRLARNLLSDDGAIFISIDDNEVHNLRKICDEVFGEQNFLATFKWNRTAKAPSLSNDVRTKYEYVLCYQKNETEKFYGKQSYNTEAPLLNMPNKQNKITFPIGAIEMPGDMKSGVYSEKYQVELLDDVLEENGVNKNSFSILGKFKWSQEKINDYLSKGLRFLIKKDFSTIYYKMDPSESFIPPADIINDEECGVKRNTDANEYMEKLGIKFDYSKPVSLIKYLAKMNTYNDKEAIILDFFAGSGSTGDAIMRLNADDNGNRHFILCQWPEKISDKESNYNTIDELTAERLRRVGSELKNKSLSIDTGFRVFHIDEQNENDGIRKPLKQISQSDLFSAIDNVKQDRTPLDLLFGVIYFSALPFDLKLETRKIGKNTVYLYGYLDEGTGLVACFDNNISEETIKEIAGLKALTAAFKDSSFADSAAKINLSEHFRIITPDTKVKVI